MDKSLKIVFTIFSAFLLGQTNQLTPETAAQLAAGKETVAILDFEGRGISQMEAQTLTDRLMSEMVNTNAVIMVERNQMEEIMQEQGFQQSGCTTSECAAEVGALLGVQNMVSGSFGKLGNSYTIDAKLFSVSTGGTIRSVSKTYKGEVDGVSSRINAETRSLLTRIKINNKNYELIPGSLLEVNVNYNERSSLSIPDTSIMYEGNKKFVYMEFFRSIL